MLLKLFEPFPVNDHGITLASKAVWELLLSAFGGSAATYVLSGWREGRRTAETYRQPQRQAVGDIAATKNALVTAVGVAHQAIADELTRGGWPGRPGGQLEQNRFAAEMNDVRGAASDVIRTVDLGRIVVVDPACAETLNAANLAIQHVALVLSQPRLRNFVEAPLYADHLMELMVWLECHVQYLVDVAVRRLGPVVPLRVRLQRARQRFDRWGDAKIAEWRRLEESEGG